MSNAVRFLHQQLYAVHAGDLVANPLFLVIFYSKSRTDESAHFLVGVYVLEQFDDRCLKQHETDSTGPHVLFSALSVPDHRWK